MNVCLSQKVVLGIDIGGTNIRLAFVGQNREIYKSQAVLVSELGIDRPLSVLIEIIADFVLENKDYHTLEAIGIGIPGIINRDGNILSCPNIAFLENSNLKNLLKDRFKIPVFVEKDVNLLLFNEIHSLKLKGVKNMAGFYIGTGFGCSLIINGDIYSGSHGFAGELGHIPLVDHFGKCNCGNEGCLELYGAGRALVEMSKFHEIDSIDFFGSPITVEESAKFLNYVKSGILTTVNIFDPEVIVIGGGVVQMEGFPWGKLEDGIRAGLRSNAIKETFRIYPSQADRFAGCVGAACYYFARLT